MTEHITLHVAPYMQRSVGGKAEEEAEEEAEAEAEEEECNPQA